MERQLETRRHLLRVTGDTAAAVLIAGCGGPGEDPNDEDGGVNGTDGEDGGVDGSGDEDGGVNGNNSEDGGIDGSGDEDGGITNENGDIPAQGDGTPDSGEQ